MAFIPRRTALALAIALVLALASCSSDGGGSDDAADASAGDDATTETAAGVTTTTAAGPSLEALCASLVSGTNTSGDLVSLAPPELVDDVAEAQNEDSDAIDRITDACADGPATATATVSGGPADGTEITLAGGWCGTNEADDLAGYGYRHLYIGASAGPAVAGDGLIIVTAEGDGPVTLSTARLVLSDDPAAALNLESATGELTADGGQVEITGQSVVDESAVTVALDITC